MMSYFIPSLQGIIVALLFSKFDIIQIVTNLDKESKNFYHLIKSRDLSIDEKEEASKQMARKFIGIFLSISILTIVCVLIIMIPYYFLHMNWKEIFEIIISFQYLAVLLVSFLIFNVILKRTKQ